MKRCEIHAFLDLLNNLVSDELAAHELLCSMNNSVSYCLDIFQCRKDPSLFVEESVNDSLDSDCMILDRHLLYHFLLAGSLMLEAAHFHSDSLYDTLCKKVINFVIFHVEKLVLE